MATEKVHIDVSYITTGQGIGGSGVKKLANVGIRVFQKMIEAMEEMEPWRRREPSASWDTQGKGGLGGPLCCELRPEWRVVAAVWIWDRSVPGKIISRYKGPEVEMSKSMTYTGASALGGGWLTEGSWYSAYLCGRVLLRPAYTWCNCNLSPLFSDVHTLPNFLHWRHRGVM